MTIPAAGQIEMAADSLQQLPTDKQNQQVGELKTFGAAAAIRVGATGCSDTSNTLSADFIVGYQLGLQTARMVLLLTPSIEQAGLDPASLL
jgi:hypothetical protein